MTETKVANAHMMMVGAHIKEEQPFLFVRFADQKLAKVPISDLKLEKLKDARLSLPNPYELEIFVKDKKAPHVYPWSFARVYCDAELTQRMAEASNRQTHSLATRVKAFRKQAALTQEALATMSGVTRMTIYSIENEKQYLPKVSTLQKLAKAFRCELFDLFS